MTLFNDNELFTTGTEQKKVYDLSGLDLMKLDAFIPKE